MSFSLQQRFDAFADGECSPSDFMQELSARCDATPSDAWAVLSLVDQYYRRGKLSAEQFKNVRSTIVPHVLGVRDAVERREFALPRRVSGVVMPEPPQSEIPDDAANEALANEKLTNQALANELRVLRVELLKQSQTAQRYRKRIAALVAFGRRTRSDLANTRQTMVASPTVAERPPVADVLPPVVEALQPVVESLPPAMEAPLPAQTLTPALAASPQVIRVPRVAARRRSIWSRLRAARVALLGLMLLALGASVQRQELPKQITVPVVAPVTIVPALVPTVLVPGEVSLSADKYVVFPGHSSAEIRVERRGGSDGDVSFFWQTQGAGAKPGKDYVATAGKTAHMLDGEASWSVSIPIRANPARKHTEMFYVDIGKPGGGASLGPIKRAAVFIMRAD